jgi:RNA polymerase sigma factor (sigma-70 family)
MNAGQLREVVGGLRRAADPPGTSDAELLRRYAAGDEVAFELLVWRHAAMVLGVSRRVLHHAQDAEDAFQAAWLALARRARAVGRRGSVAGWLNQVAYRAALRARDRQAQRAHREQPITTPLIDATAADPAAEAGWRELQQVLDEQLDQLPERFRSVFVLRYLAGLTGVEAARALGCPIGTVVSRLVRARERLRTALTRRGFTVPAGLLAGSMALDALAPRTPAALVAAAVTGANGWINSQAGTLTEAAALAEGVLRNMWLNKLKKISTAMVLALAILGAGIAWYTAQAGQGVGDNSKTLDPENGNPYRAVTRHAGELETEWVLESAEVAGKADADAGGLKNELRWLIRGDTITIQRFGQSSTGTIQTDPKKSPCEVDIHLIEGPVPGARTYRGVYKREGMRLTVCYAGAGEPRPIEFATKAGSSAMLVVFRWTDNRPQGGLRLPGNRDLTYPPPPVIDPKKAAPTEKKDPSPEVRFPLDPSPVQLLAPELLPHDLKISPAIMPGGPITLPPGYAPATDVYMMPASELYRITTPLLKKLLAPPVELPKDEPLPKPRRVDGSKDA